MNCLKFTSKVDINKLNDFEPIYGAEGKIKKLYRRPSDGPGINKVYCVAKRGAGPLKKELAIINAVKDKEFSDLRVAVGVEKAGPKDQVNGRFTLIMDKAEGNLEEKIAQKLTTHEKMSFVLDILKGLDQFHEAGYVHTDMKLDNILIFKDEKGNKMAKIADFDKSLQLGPNETGSFKGKRLFAAPEAELKGIVSQEGDVFTTALSLIQILETGGINPKKIRDVLVTDLGRSALKGGGIKSLLDRVWRRIQHAVKMIFLGRDSRAEDISTKIHAYIDQLDIQSDIIKTTLKNMTKANAKERCSANEAHDQMAKAFPSTKTIL